MQIFDTDIAVDILRGYAPAVQWFQSLTPFPAIAGLAYMEVVGGCLNKSEIVRVQAIFAPLPVFWPTESDCKRALAEFTRFSLSHNLGLLDSLIAATAVGLSATLCTFNVKHFAVVPNLLTAQPYARS